MTERETERDRDRTRERKESQLQGYTERKGRKRREEQRRNTEEKMMGDDLYGVVYRRRGRDRKKMYANACTCVYAYVM